MDQVKRQTTVYKRPPISVDDMSRAVARIAGDMATLPDGSVYIWSQSYGHWAPWKGATS